MISSSERSRSSDEGSAAADPALQRAACAFAESTAAFLSVFKHALLRCGISRRGSSQRSAE